MRAGEISGSHASARTRPTQHTILYDIAAMYGGDVVGDQVLIPTEGHSFSDRGTAIKFDHRAPDGVLVHVFNGNAADAMAVKDMLRRDGFLTGDADPADPSIRQAALLAQTERLKRQRAAARRADEIMRSAKVADPSHPYLVRKNIPGEQLWQRGDYLVVPMIDPDARLWNVQRIGPDGTKRFLAGGRTKGLLWFAGAPAGLICLGEGMATMAAIRRATGHGVLAALSASNLPIVAQIVHERSPDIPLIIAADDDAAGIKAAHDAAALTGARIALPREL